MIPMHKAYELIYSGHTIFLRPGSVFMQVVPLGTEWAAEVCYLRLARNVGLRARLLNPDRTGQSDPKTHDPGPNPVLWPEKMGPEINWEKRMLQV